MKFGLSTFVVWCGVGLFLLAQELSLTVQIGQTVFEGNGVTWLLTAGFILLQTFAFSYLSLPSGNVAKRGVQFLRLLLGSILVPIWMLGLALAGLMEPRDYLLYRPWFNILLHWPHHLYQKVYAEKWFSITGEVSTSLPVGLTSFSEASALAQAEGMAFLQALALQSGGTTPTPTSGGWGWGGLALLGVGVAVTVALVYFCWPSTEGVKSELEKLRLEKNQLNDRLTLLEAQTRKLELKSNTFTKAEVIEKIDEVGSGLTSVQNTVYTMAELARLDREVATRAAIIYNKRMGSANHIHPTQLQPVLVKILLAHEDFIRKLSQK